MRQGEEHRIACHWPPLVGPSGRICLGGLESVARGRGLLASAPLAFKGEIGWERANRGRGGGPEPLGAAVGFDLAVAMTYGRSCPITRVQDKEAEKTNRQSPPWLRSEGARGGPPFPFVPEYGRANHRPDPPGLAHRPAASPNADRKRVILSAVAICVVARDYARGAGSAGFWAPWVVCSVAQVAGISARSSVIPDHQRQPFASSGMCKMTFMEPSDSALRNGTIWTALPPRNFNLSPREALGLCEERRVSLSNREHEPVGLGESGHLEHGTSGQTHPMPIGLRFLNRLVEVSITDTSPPSIGPVESAQDSISHSCGVQPEPSAPRTRHASAIDEISSQPSTPTILSDLGASTVLLLRTSILQRVLENDAHQASAQAGPIMSIAGSPRRACKGPCAAAPPPGPPVLSINERGSEFVPQSSQRNELVDLSVKYTTLRR
ncbi:hypothetical protein H4582DRAFT_2132709 [Lactarius indigo]|nr:hypothetical protein H4582DRAFT_2132709 [Lactarius indigo]